MLPMLMAAQGRWWCPMCGAGTGWGMMFLMTVVWVAVLWLLFTLVRRMVAGGGAPPGGEGGGDRAEEILRQRYARGEIDRDTFDRMMTDLQHGAQPR